MSSISEILSLDNIGFLLQGAWISLVVALSSLVFGLLLGTLAASMKISQNKVLKTISNIYIEVIRGTPMLLQLTFLYLAVPSIYRSITGTNMPVNPLVLGVIGVSINSGAYIAELIRGAINAVDKGQWEAGKSLNLSHRQTLRLIILPQAFKNLIPSLTSELIMLVKDSSLISSIGGMELMHNAKVIGTNYYDFTIPLLAAGVIYLIITLTISTIAAQLEKRMMISD